MNSDWFKKLFKNFKYKYRFVIYNENTYETRYSFLLSKLNVFLLLSLIIVSSILLSIFLISVTSLKYYLPGMGEFGVRKQLREVIYESDQLNQKLKDNEAWANNIRKVLTGDIKSKDLDVDSVIKIDSVKIK